MQDNKQLVVLDFWWSMKTVRGHSQHGFRPRQANSGSVLQQDDGIDLDLGKVRFQLDKVESSKQRPRVLWVSEGGTSWEDPFKEGWSLREAREVVKPSQPQYFAQRFVAEELPASPASPNHSPLSPTRIVRSKPIEVKPRRSHSRHSRRTIVIQSTGANFLLGRWYGCVFMVLLNVVVECFFVVVPVLVLVLVAGGGCGGGDWGSHGDLWTILQKNHKSCHSTDGAASEEGRWVDILMTLCFSIFFAFMLALHSEPWVVKLRYSAACLAIMYQAPTMQSFCERWDSFIKGTPQTSPRSR